MKILARNKIWGMRMKQQAGIGNFSQLDALCVCVW